jgi:hypothetical protein
MLIECINIGKARENISEEESFQPWKLYERLPEILQVYPKQDVMPTTDNKKPMILSVRIDAERQVFFDIIAAFSEFGLPEEKFFHDRVEDKSNILLGIYRGKNVSFVNLSHDDYQFRKAVVCFFLHVCSSTITHNLIRKALDFVVDDVGRMIFAGGEIKGKTYKEYSNRVTKMLSDIKFCKKGHDENLKKLKHVVYSFEKNGFPPENIKAVENFEEFLQELGQQRLATIAPSNDIANSA